MDFGSWGLSILQIFHHLDVLPTGYLLDIPCNRSMFENKVCVSKYRTYYTKYKKYYIKNHSFMNQYSIYVISKAAHKVKHLIVIV